VLILNVGNLLNSDWGLVQVLLVQPIGVSVDQTTKDPTYTFNGTQTKTFNYDASLSSDGKRNLELDIFSNHKYSQKPS
jgi:hypothetical protein